MVILKWFLGLLKQSQRCPTCGFIKKPYYLIDIGETWEALFEIWSCLWHPAFSCFSSFTGPALLVWSCESPLLNHFPLKLKWTGANKLPDVSSIYACICVYLGFIDRAYEFFYDVCHRIGHGKWWWGCCRFKVFSSCLGKTVCYSNVCLGYLAILHAQIHA